ncbi:GNAT family N-acetyltransferase [Bosea sp. 117]|uniref:GNAT family N-acetyltransferase n=1 Tax=Bosea sp. 117 TaxID=1125973 RepID=UPI00049469E9|nr:GNAT family N-acetyltransferase [Bosea sp. 117]
MTDTASLTTTLVLDGYTPLPAGKIAAIVTFLEMRAPPAPMREPAVDGLHLDRVERPDLGWYRALFRRMGEDWLWFSRLMMADDELARVLGDPAVEIYVLRQQVAGGTEDIGLLELDARTPGEVELAFFGVVPERAGQGLGRYLMNRAMERAWSFEPTRVHVHTCSHDHPAAVSFYMKAGFIPVARAVEVVDDPRLTGALSRDAAPQIPMIVAG